MIVQSFPKWSGVEGESHRGIEGEEQIKHDDNETFWRSQTSLHDEERVRLSKAKTNRGIILMGRMK